MFSKASRSIYKDNKVLYFLFDHLFAKYGSVRILILMFIIPVLLGFLAGYLDGTLHSTSTLVGVVEDYPFYTLIIVVLLAVHIYYKYSVFLDKFFHSQLPNILNSEFISTEDVTSMDDRFSRIVTPKGGYLVFYIIVIFGFVLFWGVNLSNSFDPVAHYGKDIWHSANHVFGFIILKSTNLLYTTILLSIVFHKSFVGIVAFSWLFKKISEKDGFFIKPLSPDNCAGLRILSDLSLFFMFMILPFFLVFLSFILRGTNLLPTQQVIFLILIILLFVTFFLPLGAVHSAMKRAKVLELEKISSQFYDLNEIVKRRLKDKTYDDKALIEIEILEKIDFLFTKVERMPVWPFNLNNLGRLLFAAAIPVIVLLIQLIVNADSIIYNLDKLEIFKPFFK